MIPATHMISKIQWDKNMVSSKIILGYWDRVLKEIQYIKYERIWTDPEDKFSFQVAVDNKVVNIPYHRLRVVKYKGDIIWERK